MERRDSNASTSSDQETQQNLTKNYFNEDMSETNEIIFKRSIFEMLATFLFIFIIILCRKDIQKFILGMWIILIVFAKFSGPHLNPAISLGFYINKGKFQIGFSKFFIFVLAQFIGCFIGIFVSYLITNKIDFIDIPDDTNIYQIFLSEAFFTGTLFFIIIFVSYKQTQISSKGYVNAFFIVCWFYVIVNAGALISGAAFNPAVLLCLNSVAIIFDNNEHAKADFEKLIVMIFAQFIGVLIFASLYKSYADKFAEEREKRRKTKFSFVAAASFPLDVIQEENELETETEMNSIN
jgi:glycerol uptake facilitator-like aquaporin